MLHAHMKHVREGKIWVPVHYRADSLAVTPPDSPERVLGPRAHINDIVSSEPVNRAHAMPQHDGLDQPSAFVHLPCFVDVARPRRPAELSQHVLGRRLLNHFPATSTLAVNILQQQPSWR